MSGDEAASRHARRGQKQARIPSGVRAFFAFRGRNTRNDMSEFSKSTFRCAKMSLFYAEKPMEELKGGGVSDEHDGIAGGSRDKRKLEAEKDAEGLSAADEGQPGCPKESRRSDEHEEKRDEIARKILDRLPEEEREELVEEHFAGLVTQWSGELPAPESFSAYPEYAQRAMVAWNDARTLDESKRLDRLVDASAKSVAREQWLTFALNVLFSVLTLIAFVLTGSWVSFGFMAVPAISIAVNLKSDKKKSDE